ncbi:MAG: hypothetical protein PHP25_01160 [Candidatus Moranbacteria bacterium]|nr:hypothetical protein [Candidatus Moranbacteria bacterium]
MSHAAHDDRYFIDMANNILKLNWLGEYNSMTLIKGPGYPLFIALNFILGIPLLFSQNLLYIFACVTLVLALKPLFEKKYYLLSAIFLAVLFNPTSFSSEVATRAFREGIYATLSLFIVAFSIGILTHRNKPAKNILLWTAGLSAFLSFFWITREEGIWIMPFLVVISLFNAFKLWKEKSGRWKLKIKLLAVPFAILYISVISISAINYFKYGLFDVVEFKNSAFLEAYGSLTRVKDEKWMQYVPVSKEKRMKIYKVSPAFKKLEPLLEGDMGRGWAQHAQDSVKQKAPGEIHGGWFMWAFRDAVASSGYYTNSKDTMDYYKQLSSEIDAACERKELDCFKKRKSMTTPFYKEQIDPIIKSFVQATDYLIRFGGSDVRLTSSSVGDKESLDFYSEITREPTYVKNENENQIEIRGWAFSPKGAVSISVVDRNELIQKYSIETTASPDVFNSFSAQGNNFENAKQSRFSILTSCVKDCFFVISGPDNTMNKIPLDGSTFSINKDNIIFGNIEGITTKQNAAKAVDSSLRKLDARKITMLNDIGKPYRFLMLFLSIISLLIFVGTTFSRNKEKNVVYFINLFLLLLIGTRLALIAIIDATSFLVITNYYLSSLHALLILFVMLNFFSLLPLTSGDKQRK